MRIAIAAIAASLCAVAPALAGAADNNCIDTNSAIEKMQAPGMSVAKLSGKQVQDLASAFAVAYPKQRMASGDSALVFHRQDAPTLDWVILFQKGCASAELPIGSQLTRGVMGDPSAGAPDTAP
jgi:hypothetical protein